MQDNFDGMNLACSFKTCLSLENKQFFMTSRTKHYRTSVGAGEDRTSIPYVCLSIHHQKQKMLLTIKQLNNEAI